MTSADTNSLQQELRQTRPFRSLTQEAAIAILRTADVLRRRIGETVEPFGISIQQYNVLRILRGAHPEPLATYEVAERMIEQTPGVTRLLDRIEERGWAVRGRCEEDRRLVHCRITAAGLALLDQMEAAVDAADDSAVGDLAPDELATLNALLARVRRGR